MPEESPESDTIVFINISAVCRLCLATDELSPLIESEELEDFRSSVNIKLLLNDEYPKKICKNCAEQLKQTSKFLGQCRLAHSVLLGIVEVVQNNADSAPESEDDEAKFDPLKLNDEEISEALKQPKRTTRRLQECNVCNTQTSDMPTHRKTNPKCRLRCGECAYRHWNPSDMQKHKRRVHASRAAYSCPICQKQLKYKHSLKRHVRVHQFGEQFPCELCDKSKV